MPVWGKSSSGVTDLSGLTGLNNNANLPQYTLIDGTRAFTGNVSLGNNRLGDVSAIEMPSAASNPVIPSSGDVYFNTTDTTIRRYNGATWDVYSSSGADHGALTGLGDDDHDQYIRTDGGRAFTGDVDFGGNDLTNIGTIIFPSAGSNPIGPATGQIYWNTSDLTLRRYDGSSWDILDNGTTNHGALNGLDDDDHPQYIYVDGRRAFTGTVSFGSQRLEGIGRLEIPFSSSDLGSPETGEIYWNTTDATIRRYNGSTWDTSSSSATAAATSFDDGVAALGETDVQGAVEALKVLVDAAGGGNGDVVGPGSATDNALTRYDTTTGKLIQNSVVTVSDTGATVGQTSVQLADVSAPANPGAGKGELYKKTGNDGLFWLPDAAGPEVDLTDVGTGDVVGPGSATDNAVPRYDSTTGKIIQGSSVVIDDTNNVSGVVNLSQTGYIQVSDITAPANPSAGQGRLYKKTGSGGLFWLPDAAGPEVDVTPTGVVAQFSQVYSGKANYALDSHYSWTSSTGPTATNWIGNYGADATSVTHNIRGYTLPVDCDLKDAVLAYDVNASHNTHEATIKIVALSLTQGSTAAQVGTVLVSESLGPHITSNPYTRDLTITTAAVTAGQRIGVFFVGTIATVHTIDFALYLRFEAT